MDSFTYGRDYPLSCTTLVLINNEMIVFPIYMVINESFFSDGNIEDINSAIEDTETASDSEVRNKDWMLQDKRPIEQLIGEYPCIVNFKLMFDDTGDDAYKEIDKMCRKLRMMFSNFDSGEMSPVIVGSCWNEDQWRYSTVDTGFTTYVKYLLNQTQHDKGIQRNTQLFFGIRLNCGDVVNLEKAYDFIRFTIKAVNNITKAEQVLILFKNHAVYKNSVTWDEMYFNPNHNAEVSLRKAISYTEPDEDPNYAPLDSYKEMLFVVSGKTVRDAWNLDDDVFIRQMREMLG